MGAEPDAGFGVYVHWPFCAAKCPYCDFNSHVRADVDQSRWARSLVRELEWAAARTSGQTVHSVFFGGGTPSLMAPETVETVLSAIHQFWPVKADVEVTLEANPTSVEAQRFEGYRAAGVNRVSIGVQALEDNALQRLGRLHNVAEAMDAIELARATFPRMSFDLIYARQDQTVEAWERELTRALDLAADHLSLYQLTIEPGTAFGARHAVGRLPGLPSEDRAVRLYETTQALCAERGLVRYEISNHAQPGAQSAHNLIYWRGGDYVGVGPGAHGRFGPPGARVATETLRQPEAWVSAVEREGHGVVAQTPITPQEQAEDYLMMALRLAEGADLGAYATLAGAPLRQSRLDELSQDGLLAVEGHKLRATESGVLLLNAVLARLLT